MNKVSKCESNVITLTSIFGKKKIFFGSIWPEHNQRVNRLLFYSYSSSFLDEYYMFCKVMVLLLECVFSVLLREEDVKRDVAGHGECVSPQTRFGYTHKHSSDEDNIWITWATTRPGALVKHGHLKLSPLLHLSFILCSGCVCLCWSGSLRSIRSVSNHFIHHNPFWSTSERVQMKGFMVIHSESFVWLLYLKTC